MTGGLSAQVSDIDYDMLMQYSWWPNQSGSGNVYAYTQRTIDGKKTTIYMHRLITDCPKNMEVDHEDKDTLNNQRPNLRITTPSRNAAHRITKIGKAGYRGVHQRWLHKVRKFRYEAAIILNGTNRYLGRFDTPEDAARAYDKAAVGAFAEFATLNFREDWNFPNPDAQPSILDTF